MTWSRITISARAAMPFSRPTSFERLARNFESFRKPRTGLPILFLCASLNRNEGRHEVRLMSELTEVFEDGLHALVISLQHTGWGDMPLRVRQEECLQRLDIASREGFVAAPYDGEVASLSRARSAHLRFLPRWFITLLISNDSGGCLSSQVTTIADSVSV